MSLPRIKVKTRSKRARKSEMPAEKTMTVRVKFTDWLRVGQLT